MSAATVAAVLALVFLFLWDASAKAVLRFLVCILAALMVLALLSVAGEARAADMAPKPGSAPGNERMQRTDAYRAERMRAAVRSAHAAAAARRAARARVRQNRGF